MSTPLHRRVSQLISRLYKVCFCYLAYGHRISVDYGASQSFGTSSSVDGLGLEVENMEELFHVSSPLGTRVRIDHICQDYGLENSGIQLTMDLRVMYI